MAERGVIINRKRAEQLRDFSGLCYGTKTPTDIDGFIDFENKLFILFELKYKQKELGKGQRLAFERLCDAIENVPCYFLIATHSNTEDDIQVSKSVVVETRYNKKWIILKWPLRMDEAIERILIKHNLLKANEYQRNSA